ncbi:MAG: amidohydrolase family protein [Bacteroidetes bacterium]|nr:amidohydrolase family protein [Bacteroidota bacterium]
MNILRLFTTLIVSIIAMTSAMAQLKTIVFTHANVIDGKSDSVIKDVTLIISNGKIREIKNGRMGMDRNARIFDLKGKYIMPGLIDAHVHLGSWEAAKTALHSGVTTVRSMGVSHFMDVGMRELAQKGLIESPEILAAGYHVRPKPADAFFEDRPDLGYLMEKGVKGVEAVRAMGQAMVDQKVDWIKVNATARAGLVDTDPREPYYNEEELRALVETGAKAGIPVAAHAHGDEGGMAAVKAGVKSIEHGTYLSEETLKLMVEKGTYLVPTIAIVSDLAEPGGDYDEPLLAVRGRHMLPRVRETATKAYQLGVKLIAATDTGYDPESVMRLGLELEELVNIGMPAWEAIQAAT